MSSEPGDLILQKVGLRIRHILSSKTGFWYTDASWARSAYKPRSRFDHKGVFGHVLLVCGSYGKAGAAVLAARAALRAGAGLVTLHVPAAILQVIQTAVPEAMTLPDPDNNVVSRVPSSLEFDAVGTGCALGTSPTTAIAFEQLLEKYRNPMVIDADGLNLLAKKPGQMDLIPEGSILTPHLKEFERLFGEADNHLDRLAKARDAASRYQVVIVVKGAHTAVVAPDGNVYFNSTGNPGMATAGSGDVLTGILAALLARGYSPVDAAMLGVYIHGLAGDVAAAEFGETAMIAGDIVTCLPDAFLSLEG